MTAQEHPHISGTLLKDLPSKPGVYLMRDEAREVIYIGKAKNLRNRVKGYFNDTDIRWSIQFLLQRIRNIETIVTPDERQAILLESDLIKKYKPKYNIRLKDDKAYLAIRIDTNNPWPRLDLVRRVEDDGAKYLGPFAFAHELYELLEIVRKTVPLRTCSDKVFQNRVRPCLEYQIKRCAGPCCLPVSREDYEHWLEQAVQILQGKNKEVFYTLEQEMERASEQLRFEDAAQIRDRLSVFERVQEDRKEAEYGMGTKDIVGIYREEKVAEACILLVRRGRLFEAKSFQFEDLEIPDSELLRAVISQFYSGDQEFPEEIITATAVDDQEAREELYSERAGRKVSFVVPKQGSKARLVGLAETNARENFLVRFGRAGAEDAATILRTELGLAQVPRTIECVDVSHFQGGQTVAAVVCFQDGHPEKSRYRAFHLQQEGKPDDFASMREVVFRHLSRSAEENVLPDLMMIDGGPAQLSSAIAQRDALGLLTPPMIGLAKKRTLDEGRMSESVVRHKPERVYLESGGDPVVLRPQSKALHLLERIRDEAHRFAINFHRKTRKRRTFSSVLESVPGIGLERRKKLLKTFGSVRALKTATAEEISERCSIPLSLSLRILQTLTKRDTEE